MKLIISVANEQIALHADLDNYHDLCHCIKQNFENSPSRFTITYKDQENDEVGLCSQKDF